jgi:histidinol-phosphate aminotransferase
MARNSEDRRMLDIHGMARSAILNTREYIPGKPIEAVKREYGIDRALKLASNENPLGTSPLAVEAMIREIRESSHLYPESLCPELIAKLSERFNLPAGSFYVDNGGRRGHHHDGPDLSESRKPPW